MTQAKNPLATPANIVTLVRIVLIPLFVFALLAPWPSFFPGWEKALLFQPWVAAGVYALLACTDALDGYLARSRNEVTTLGKFLDPLADKILVAAALLALCELGTLSTWIALIILAREFIISGLRMVASVEGVVIAASWYGKWKTATTIVAIIMFIVKDSAFIHALGEGFAKTFNILSWIVMIIALILTVVSMLDYFLKANKKLGLFSSKSSCRSKSELSAAVIASASKKGLRLACAESCTGGLIGAALTDTPGSSQVFVGGVISYSNDVKASALDVSLKSLDDFGAVSTQVAEEMAKGVCSSLKADVAVSVSGIAGPGGGSEDKPVGTVCFGICSPLRCWSCVEFFDGDRKSVRESSCRKALELLLSEIESI